MIMRLDSCTLAATLSPRSLLSVIALIAAFSMSIDVVRAQQSSIGAVADGKPWSFTTPGKDRIAILTLNKDGNAIMKVGSHTVYPKWHEAAGDFCLAVMPSRPERCVALKQAKHGFDAVEGDAVTFQLRR